MILPLCNGTVWKWERPRQAAPLWCCCWWHKLRTVHLCRHCAFVSDLNVSWRWVEDCSHSFRRGLAVSSFPVESGSTNCAVRHHRTRCSMGSGLVSVGTNFRCGIVVFCFQLIRIQLNIDWNRFLIKSDWMVRRGFDSDQGKFRTIGYRAKLSKKVY